MYRVMLNCIPNELSFYNLARKPCNLGGAIGNEYFSFGVSASFFPLDVGMSLSLCLLGLDRNEFIKEERDGWPSEGKEKED